jgi:uncharacterized protein (DUF58 family)
MVSPEHDPFGPGFEQKLEMLALLSRKLDPKHHRNEIVKQRRGSGIEFVDHRNYQLGDDPRLIDWNATQRLDRLLLRINQEHEDRSTYVLLDQSESMRYPTVAGFELGQQLAAALSYLALCHFDRVMVGTFHDDQLDGAPPKRGTSRILPIMRFLRSRRAEGTTSLQDSMRKFTARYQRPGVVYLLSDLHDSTGFERAIDALRYARHLVHVVHLLAPREAAPQLHGDVTLLDSETGARLDLTVTPALLRRIELANVTKAHRIAHYCRTHRLTYHQARVGCAFEQIVFSILRTASESGSTRPEP